MVKTCVYLIYLYIYMMIVSYTCNIYKQNLSWFPFSLYRMSLNVMTLRVTSSEVYTSQGVPLTVSGVAQVSVMHILPKLIGLERSNCPFDKP